MATIVNNNNGPIKLVVVWTLEEIKAHAIMESPIQEWYNYYDEEEFPNVLTHLAENYDPNYGITSALVTGALEDIARNHSTCSCGEPKDPSDKHCRACQAEDEADFKEHRRREDRI